MARLAFVLSLVLASGTAWAADGIPSACSTMVTAIGVPQFKTERAEYLILCREGYVLAHNNERKTPEWVVERLKPDRFEGDGDRKKQGNPFAADPDLAAAGVGFARPSDYKKQKSVKQKRSFDQGHMAPAADMKFSIAATEESFYMSNMAPQQGSNLNRHIWADLEALSRDWACDRKDIYVITGPIYDEEEPDTLGTNEVQVPTAFYKMVYEPRQRRLLSFILPNEPVSKEGAKSFEALQRFIVPLSEVEQRTSIKFFAKLESRDRKRLLALKSPMWPVVQGCATR